MKSEILRMLKEKDDYVSGQELCEQFHVSRTAVWKVIRQLKSEGYELEAVRGRGYRLREAADILSKTELLSSITTQWAGRNILYFEETDSTNTEAKRAAEAGAPHGTLAVAESQTAGKGRRGRSWSSPRGTGIFMSLLTRPDLPPQCAPMLTLVAALAVAEGIRRTAGVEARIKWPNDIVAGGKKLCGILTEMSADMDGINHVVTGIGINVNQTEFPEEVREVATSLFLETGRRLQRSLVIAAVMEAFERLYPIFLGTGDLSGLLAEYNGSLANRNNAVRVLIPGAEYTGTALGIDESGALLVRDDEGTVKKIISGEVSVRGIYGYV